MFELEETINPGFELEESYAPSAIIKVIGVGGAGGNAVNRMVESGVRGVQFIAMNTDMQALAKNKAERKLQLGAKLTGGKGAGANPEVGRQSALESEEEILDILRGADMVFIAAGLGKGTGTGAAPIVAELSRRLGILTIPVVTKPFTIDGEVRRRTAEEGLSELRKHAESVLVIPNDRIMAVAGRVPLNEAYRQVDDTLRHAIQSISDVVSLEGDMNCDFNDVRTIMGEHGGTYMGVGAADGEDSAVRAAEQALQNPYLESGQVVGATGLLVTISVKDELRFSAVDLTAILTVMRSVCDKEANLIHGLAFNPKQVEDLRVTVIATGFESTKEEAKPMASSEFPWLNGLNLMQAPKAATLSPNGLKLSTASDTSSEDLDIPAFMRRKHFESLERTGKAA